MIFTDEDFAASHVEAILLPDNETEYIAFCFVNVTLEDRAHTIVENVYVVSIFDPYDITGFNMTNESAQSQVLMGTQLERVLEANSVSIGQGEMFRLHYGNNSAEIRTEALYPGGSIFPDDWLVVPRGTIDYLRPELEGNYSFLMVIEDEPGDWQSYYGENGIMTMPTSGVVGFFERGIYQVEDDLWAIIAITGLITSLLVYCIISIETEYNAPTIKILRGIGATRYFVIKIFIFKSLFITFVGGIIGVALGFCTASAIASVSSLFNVTTFVVPVASFESVIMPVIIALISGFVGGIWPAIRASRMFTIRRN